MNKNHISPIHDISFQEGFITSRGKKSGIKSLGLKAKEFHCSLFMEVPVVPMFIWNRLLVLGKSVRLFLKERHTATI
jgi:hypothetical protein